MSAERAGAVVGGVLLLVGVGLAAVRGARSLDLGGPRSDPDPMGAPPPAADPAALWSGALATPEVAPLARKGLDHHPALVVSAAARPGAGTPAGHRALAAASLDPLLEDALSARLRLQPAAIAWALDPRLADAAAEGCPAAALGALCEPVGRSVVEAQVDAVLAGVLVDPDPARAAAALAAACRLGPVRGRALAEPLRGHGEARVAAVGLRLWSCADAGAARPALVAALDDPALAPVAALELARVGAIDALQPVAAAPTAAGIAARAAAP